MFDLFQELSQVAKALNKEQIAYALIGGLAYSVLVELRATEDIDLLIVPEDWDRIQATLKSIGYQSLSEPMDGENIRMRRLVKIQREDMLLLDFILADGDLRRGLERPIMVKRDEVVFPVAPPSVLIDLKKRRLSERDQLDIAGLEKLIQKPDDKR